MFQNETKKGRKLMNLQVIEHQSQRVLLTQQLAESYGTDNKSISYNFNHNKERYQEGKHYFLLQGNDLKAFREIHDLPNNLNKVYLWTERGAFLHAKSLNTDKAWEVYDSLVEHYFKSREEEKVSLPSDPMEILKLVFQAQTQTNEKVEKHDQRIAELENNALLTPGQYNYLSKAVQRKVAQIKKELGWKLQSKQNSQLYRSINRDLDRYIGIKTRSQLRVKEFDKALQFIENWQLSYADKMIIEQLSLDV